jgi:hypothetical protein
VALPVESEQQRTVASLYIFSEIVRFGNPGKYGKYQYSQYF